MHYHIALFCHFQIPKMQQCFSGLHTPAAQNIDMTDLGKNNLKHVTAQGGKNGKNLAGHRLKPDRNQKTKSKIKRWRTEMLIFHFCFMPLCKGKFVCLFLHYILGTQPTAHNEITKTLDLSRILIGGEEGLKEKRKNQNYTNSSHSGQFMLFVVFCFVY